MSEIYTPEDLQRGIFALRDANSRPPMFAVFGRPIAHSLSPIMQNAALADIAKSNDIYRDSKYFAFDVSADSLANVLPEFWNKNFAGINLTIPHKEIAVGLVSELDDFAKTAGACNTLLKTDSGWKGFNTDGFGLDAALKSELGRELKGSRVFIIGAGGAARGAAFYAASAGCESLTLVNRSAERLHSLASDLRANGAKCETAPISDCENLVPSGAIVINATSIGLKDSDAPVLNFSKLHKTCVFFDMPYRRGAKTSSVAAAEKNSISAADGLAMLAWQGAKSLSIWTGESMRGKLMLETLKKIANGYH